MVHRPPWKARNAGPVCRLCGPARFQPLNAEDEIILNIYNMKLSTLTKITRVAICALAVALGVAALFYNKAHCFTAALIFAVGLNVEWKNREGVI